MPWIEQGQGHRRIRGVTVWETGIWLSWRTRGFGPGVRNRGRPLRIRKSLPVAHLFLGHEGVCVIRRRREGFLHRSRAYPPHEVHFRSGLVVGARGARAAKRLLPDDRAR